MRPPRPTKGAYMDVAPYLVFDGHCEEAFLFYEQSLGGRIVAMTTFGESPMAQHAPPDWHGKILHARLALGDKVLMGSDGPPGRHEAMQGFSVTLTHRRPGRGRARLPRPGRGGHDPDAAPGDLLGPAVRH